MKTAAIWGASGFIGKALACAASSEGWRVRRLQRRGDGEAVILSQDDDEARMRSAVAGSGLVYHCAGKALANGTAGYADAAARFARACAREQVPQLVYLGTVAVYGVRKRGEIQVTDPLEGRDDYARSRIAAEAAMAEALRGAATRLCIVRVPAVVGEGMPGTVIARFARAVRWGLFPHPGSGDAAFACIGVRRLAALLVRVGNAPPATKLLQFSDHLRWTDIASRVGRKADRTILRIPLPLMGGVLAPLGSTARYADDSGQLAGGPALPETADDLDLAIEAALRP